MRTTYNPKQGFAPLVSFVNKHPVEVEMRSGNTTPGTDIFEHFKPVVRNLASEGVRIREYCSDAAGYNLKYIK